MTSFITNKLEISEETLANMLGVTTEELQNIKCHIKDLSVNLSNLKAAQLNHPR